jgi:hypothetical protein
VTFHISSPFPIDGDYSILWSKYASFDGGNYTVLDSGNLPSGSYSTSVRFRVPETPYGVYYVQFFQASRTPYTMQFMLRPALTLTPPEGKPGTRISVKGTGFPASDKGTLSIRNNILSIPLQTNASGNVSANFDIPDIDVGAHTVIASTYKLGAETAQATLLVNSRSQEIITFSQNEPESPPPVTQPGTGTNIANPVPPPPVTTSIRPPKPVIISPRDASFGWYGEQNVTFNWGPVPEPVDVTYTLEIGDNFNFNPPLSGMQKTRLTGTSYNIELQPGTYYWRVKAVDSAGNEGDWAYAPYAFKVGEFPLVPVIVGIVVLAIIIIFAKIIQALKKTADHYYY